MAGLLQDRDARAPVPVRIGAGDGAIQPLVMQASKRRLVGPAGDRNPAVGGSLDQPVQKVILPAGMGSLSISLGRFKA